jgi:hypothetical protein
LTEDIKIGDMVSYDIIPGRGAARAIGVRKLIFNSK